MILDCDDRTRSIHRPGESIRWQLLWWCILCLDSTEGTFGREAVYALQLEAGHLCERSGAHPCARLLTSRYCHFSTRRSFSTLQQHLTRPSR